MGEFEFQYEMRGKIVTGSEQLVPGGIPRKRNKVAIVGFAPSSYMDVKHVWDDPDFEVWAINQLYVQFPEIVSKVTRWFQIHHRHTYDAAVRDHKHHDWLAAQKAFPIYMQQKLPDIPMSVEFPVQMIIKEFGRYFTNSISWQLAMAIWEGFKEIHVYGVDMAQNDEYAEQRPSCEYFIGLARGAGIKVYVPEKSDLLHTNWLYPFEDDAPFKIKLREREQWLGNQSAMLWNQEQSTRDQRMQIIGARDNMNYVEKAWSVCRQEMAQKMETKHGELTLFKDMPQEESKGDTSAPQKSNAKTKKAINKK